MSKTEQNTKPIRDGFGAGLLSLGRHNSQVVALSADLTESVRMEEFSRKYPERFFQVGIAEQNMAGIASGLALSGYIPFIGSFACFQPMRNLDQIRTSICMMNANVKIVSSHAGFSYPADGIQIQALEDVGIMRSLPNMTVVVPADYEQASELTVQSIAIDGPVYIRLGRSATPILRLRKDSKDIQPIDLGEAQLVRAGSDVVFITYGYMVNQCLDVALELEKVGIYAGVLNMHTIKPIDAEAICDAGAHSGNIVVVEEHQGYTGLVELVAKILLENSVSAKFLSISVEDKFGRTAKTQEELWQVYGLDKASILARTKTLLGVSK